MAMTNGIVRSLVLCVWGSNTIVFSRSSDRGWFWPADTYDQRFSSLFPKATPTLSEPSNCLPREHEGHKENHSALSAIFRPWRTLPHVSRGAR